MSNKLIFSSLLLLFSCSNINAGVLLDAEICEVSIGNNSEKLQLLPPCSLVKTENGKQNFFQFNESKVYIISGAPAKLDKLKRWAVKETDRCSLEYQAVIVVKNKTSLSKVKNNGLVCPNIGLDEKSYQQFVQD
ncbi:hypothetical protein [Pseudoalteromonas distincta]|uniref:hypothetical protein n=1 Tax=Pseudoalteromonas distincta TaxID=77608 RepID=UPI0039E96C14